MVDLDISAVLRGGELSIEDAGQTIFDGVVAVSRGRMTKSEILKDDNSFAIHRAEPSV